MAFDFAAMLKQEMEQLNQKMSKNKIDNESILSDDTLPKLSLLDSKVATLPENVFYIPRFISDQEAELLVKSLEKSNWTTLANRKLQNWGGVPHPSGSILEPLPSYLKELAERLKTYQVFAEEPNQALVNEYTKEGGIDFHNDGPLFRPCAAILSLLSPCLIQFKSEVGNTEKCHPPVLLEPNSLLVFKDDAYKTHKHGILCNPVETFKELANQSLLSSVPETSSVKRGPKRISITMRCVHKVTYQMDHCNEVLPSGLEEERQRRLRWWKNAINEKEERREQGDVRTR